MNSPSRVSRLFPLVLVAVSLGIRVAAWAHWGTGTIESEGAEYAKIAENLRQGVGYVGLVSPGPQLLFHPLFPLLIAAASYVVHDFELAGRTVALIFGALLPLPVYGIASRLWNRRVGVFAALLASLHPLSVYLSFMVYSEGPYATLLLTGMYLVIRAIEGGSTRAWVLVGAVFGATYLLRGEALAAFAISMVFALLTNAPAEVKLKPVVCAIAVFLIVALPEVIFLRHSTGTLMLEAKTRVLFSYAGRRILVAEMKPDVEYVSDGGRRDVPSAEPNIEGGYSWQEKWATFGIDSQLRGTGYTMRPWVEMARETHTRFADFPPLIFKGLRRNLPNLLDKLSSRWIGAPLLPALALLGIFRRPWRGPRARTRLFVLVVSLAPVIATFLVLWGDARYYFIFAPLMCIWAANGLWEIGAWTKASSRAARWSLLARPVLSQWLLPGMLALGMLVASVGPVTSQYEFSDSGRATRIDKEIGTWLGHLQDRQVRIMDLSLPLSFHADAQQHVYFPYATSDLALRYLDAAKIDYVVLRRGATFTKYYEEWLTRGIPDDRAEMLQLPSAAASDKFIIYRWHQRPVHSS